MFLDEQIIQYTALDAWFSSPQGARVAVAFSEELNAMGEHFIGDHLLQMGCCGENPWLDGLYCRHKWIADPRPVLGKTSVLSSMSLLPIARDSMDCVIAPLTMEAIGRHKNPLDEIDRILKPMGFAVFFGVNPCSFWGAACRWGAFGLNQPALLSSFSVKRMMMQRGYRQCAFSSFYYIPPVTHPFLIKNLSFFNEMGKMIWPFPAGFYCLIVQKYQACSPSLLLDRVKSTARMQPTALA